MTATKGTATGISYGSQATPEHAKRAVQAALRKAGLGSAGSVLLFLTNGYARNPSAALMIAARAGSTTQIFGCCAAGLLTEEDWLLDNEGAVAMVFADPEHLQPARLAPAASAILNLCTPASAKTALAGAQPQIGAITTDEYGQGPFSVWQCGRVADDGYIHAGFGDDIRSGVAVAQGVRRLTEPIRVEEVDGNRLLQLARCAPLDSLLAALPDNLRNLSADEPHHFLCAISEGASKRSIESGHYTLKHVMATDSVTRSVSLTGNVQAGQYVCWAMRDERAAQDATAAALHRAAGDLSEAPDFALMFPCISRGPEFYGGEDRDLELLRERFAQLPVIGFYGNGEIAPGRLGAALLYQYSNVVGLFAFAGRSS